MNSIPPHPGTGREQGDSSQPLSAATYLAVSAGGLVLSVGLLLFLVFGSDRILAAGLDHRVFYVLLVPLGLSAAAFAFGAMKSTATYRGAPGRDVSVTGPAAFAALVVIGGFFVVPEGGFRVLTVRVDGSSESGGRPVARARVVLDWGPQRLVQFTDENGQASFVGLPPGPGDVGVAAEAEGYVRGQSTWESVPADGVVSLTLSEQPVSSRVAGTVLDRETRDPVPGVVLSFEGGAAADTTDELGNFAVVLSRADGARVSVIGTRNGIVGLNTEVIVTADAAATLLYGN